MNQEQTIYKMKDLSQFTGEMLLKMLAYMLEYSQEKMTQYMSSKHFSRETQWNRFMATSDAKEVKTFLANEINFDQLKEYLKEYKIGFSYRKNPDGKMMLAFERKNESLVKEAFERFMKDFTSPEKTEELNQKLLKSPKNMNVDEKLEKLNEKVQAEILAKEAEAVLSEKITDQEVSK